MPNNDSLDYFVKVRKEEVCFYAPFFEAYQGMLALRTPEPPKDEFAKLHFLVSPDFKADFEKLINKIGLKYESNSPHLNVGN